MNYIRSHLENNHLPYSKRCTSDQLNTFFPDQCKSVFNWSEVHLSEVTSYKIHILTRSSKEIEILSVEMIKWVHKLDAGFINSTRYLAVLSILWQSIHNEYFAWLLEIIYIVYFRQDSVCSDSEVPYVSYTISKPIGDSPKKGSKPQQSSKYKFSNPMLSQR